MRIAGRLARLEARHTPLQRAYQIVLFDAATGAPLPGHESKPNARGSIWIPDNGRDPDVFRDDARCD